MKTSFLALALAASGSLAVTAISAQDQPQIPGVVDVSRVAAGSYSLDPSHTLVSWQVGHFGFNVVWQSVGRVFGRVLGHLYLVQKKVPASGEEALA